MKMIVLDSRKWKQKYIEKKPKKIKDEQYYENHEDSDCDSTCEDCETMYENRQNFKSIAKANNYGKIMTKILQDMKIDTSICMKCVRYSINHGYIRDGIDISPKRMGVHFKKTHNQSGLV